MGKEVLGIHQEALQHRLSCAKRYTDEQKCTVPIRKKNLVPNSKELANLLSAHGLPTYPNMVND